MSMPSGRVLRSYSNVYYVEVGDEVWECRPRGRLRYRAERVLAGDMVSVSPAGQGFGAIDAILPRRNELSRPPVANVDRAVLVFSFEEPELDLVLVDRFLVLIAQSGLSTVFCVNKLDLAEAGEAERLRRVYEGLVDEFLTTSAVAGEGVATLGSLLSGRVSVMAGPSGVGKSSLLNALDPSLDLRTSNVSRKARRGTHTTRHVALLPTGKGGLVADTPGFTHLELEKLSPVDLAWYYPEMAPLAPDCRFSGCLHRTEPDCRVKEALARGEVDRGRYQRYLELLAQVEETYRPW